MITPEQGRSGIWFQPIPRFTIINEVCEQCGWEVVGFLPGQTYSKLTDVYARAIHWSEITEKMDALLKDRQPRPMSEKALDES